MTRYASYGIVMMVLSLSAGCLGDLANGGRKQLSNAPVKLPPGTESANTGAYEVFSELFAANPEMAAQLSPNSDANFRPVLQVVGFPGVSIYHRGSAELYITEGLVNRCPPEGKDGRYQGKLAAVLASELGKMVVEADTQKRLRAPSGTDQVYAPRVGSDNNSDQTELASQVMDAKNASRNRNTTRIAPSQDPNALARNYLTKANFSPNDLTHAATLIRQAENNPELEKQVNPSRNGGLPSLK